MYIKVNEEVVKFKVGYDGDNMELTLTVQEYNLLQKYNGGRAFVDGFVNQVSGKEYTLFDCVERDGKEIVAIYHLK